MTLRTPAGQHRVVGVVGTSGVRRIVVMGSGGAGKTRLAVELGQLLGLPVHHLDALLLHPARGGPSPEESLAHRQLTGRAGWIMDGTHRATLAERLDAADLAVFLDLPPVLCAVRVVSRCLRGSAGNAPDLPPGGRHRVRPGYLLHVLVFRRRIAPSLRDELVRRPELPAIILRRPREVAELLRQVAMTAEATRHDCAQDIAT